MGRSEKRSDGRSPLRTGLIWALVVFAVLFAVLNLDSVRVHWVVGTWDTSLLIVILLFFGLGALAGWFFARRSRP
ncbi:MAG: LapA family protein [Solirubrobacterales bacterium]